MAEYALYLATAIALIFVIEGLVYALFPGQIKKIMALALSQSERSFRTFGSIMAALGFLIVWLISVFT